MNYNIITDPAKFNEFIGTLPDLLPHEVFYFCLFGRHKYDPAFPNTKDSGQLARLIARNKEELAEKTQRLEVPFGSYTRDGVHASQNALALYMALNPRSLIKANKGMLTELANRFAEGHTDFNPVSLAHTQIHHAVDRKLYVDFDYDDVEPNEHLPRIKEILPDSEMYRILKTRGGFHLLIDLPKVKTLKTAWHPALAKLPKCDVKGSNTLTPVPGCTQGGFTPYFL
jgi:hypothetical protein